MAMDDCGIDKLCRCCPHFNTWINAIAEKAEKKSVR